MKSSNLSIMSATLLCAIALVLTECGKKETPAPEPSPVVTEESGQAGKDSRDVQSENDHAINDINQVMSENPRLSGRPAGTAGTAVGRPAGNICGMTIDSALSVNGVLVLNFNGTTCDNRTRTGSIKLTLQNYSTGVRWKNVGATIRVDYNSYKITRASDQASILLNGTQFYTNTSGGNWWTLLVVQTQTALVASVTGTNLNVTFQDNKTAVFNINRKLTWSLNGSVISLKAEGIGTNGTLNNLENFGTTREGEAFTSQVTTPIIWNTTCGSGAPLQGQVNIKVASKNFDLNCQYGVDASGNSITVGANQCPYGWKYTWTANAATKTKVTKYF